MNHLNTTETREKLLETAAELISKESYGHVSVDDICLKANVKKGSFYHFFPSKADLAVAAFDHFWNTKLRSSLDRIFSAQVPPLRRLVDWFEFTYQLEREKSERYGQVCGCPYTSVGAEQSTLDQKLRHSVENILNLNKKYIEAAIRDAVQEKLIPECDAKQKASEIFTFYLGGMMEAKISNSLLPIEPEKIKKTLTRFLGISAVELCR